MVFAEFEEKTYEIAYDIELSRGGGVTPWAPGQVLEHLVGFDAAADPDASHPLWRVLGASRPKGLVLLPDHWIAPSGRRPTSRQLPSNPISFLVQFKRPEFIRSHAGKQWKLWGTPYFRFKVDAAQQRTLKRLETNTAGEAIVRYASPAFSTNAAMDVARWDGKVIVSSGHVAPTTMAGHSAWTYVSAGAAGRPNPTGEEHRFDRLSDLFREPDDYEKPQPLGARSEVATVDAIKSHVEVLAGAAMTREPHLRRVVDEWRRELLREGVAPGMVNSVGQFAAVQSITARLGASWWILDREALIHQ
ncbi:hypothetical protein OVN18_08510 [Microcella daejeonensis]|uniref:Uncharacterized protein n=1 Tax=Microcella daejeonensis TaxID=2994971 RepID=A0A9E8MJB7_9MICO|nr:hypothetical protein [Microcella daejeonensis]WAB80609.1 hypothetical protein OVN18_08510 [Microcella daejeonensis]